MSKKVRNIVVLASGSGTTLQAVINAIRCGELNINISLVVSDHREAYALQRAKKAQIDTHVFTTTKTSDMDEELDKLLDSYEVDLILLAGYLRLIGPKILSKYNVVNTHPSLLPKYGGKGMHGMHVHKAVVNNGEKESGVTLHFVNEEYDKGRIIWQTHVPVYPEDTAEDVSTRVQAAEKTQLVSILKAFSEGKIN